MYFSHVHLFRARGVALTSGLWLTTRVPSSASTWIVYSTPFCNPGRERVHRERTSTSFQSVSALSLHFTRCSPRHAVPHVTKISPSCDAAVITSGFTDGLVSGRPERPHPITRSSANLQRKRMR